MKQLIKQVKRETFLQNSLKNRATVKTLTNIQRKSIITPLRAQQGQKAAKSLSYLATLLLFSGSSLFLTQYMQQPSQTEAVPQMSQEQQNRISSKISKDRHLSIDRSRQVLFIVYDEQNALQKEFLTEIEARLIFSKILKKYSDIEIVLVNVRDEQSGVSSLLDIVEYDGKKIERKKRPTVFLKADNRLTKIKASHINEKYNSNFNQTFQKEASFYKIDSVKSLADRLQQFNRNLNDVTIVYCNDPEIHDETKQIAFRLMRQETRNPILQIESGDLTEKMQMKKGFFYCYYKPSFINGFEQYIDKDINFNYLQAFEGVCRDEFTLNNDYLHSEEFTTLLSKFKGIQTEAFATDYFDLCFSRTYNVEFIFNPNFKEFKKKIKLGTAQKPMLFVYSPAMYMSRYISEFNDVLKNYQEVFEIYYTDDQQQAESVFYVKEFPEIFPYVVIVDSKKKKALKSESGTLNELTIGNNNFYFHKYREIIFFNSIQKDLNNLIDKFLDGECHHFYQSEKIQQESRVKKICTSNFEQEIVKNPNIEQCIVEIFKHDCPSCAFNGKVFNVFSRKLERHGYLNQLPCYRLSIDNKVPWLGNFGYSPIYLYVRKRGDQIIELKTMDAPQKVEGFLKDVKELSKIKGIEKNIKIKPRDQVIKHVKLEDLDPEFDIDFDTKEEQSNQVGTSNNLGSGTNKSISNKLNGTFADQANTVNGTGEINYNQTNQSNIQTQVIQGKGPQLSFDKNYLCMKASVSYVAQDQGIFYYFKLIVDLVVVTNVGSTTVTYQWKKVLRGDFIQSKNSDGIQRFYCHYVYQISNFINYYQPRSVMKPGESKTFTFSFRSSEKAGMFFEEWELLTEPLLQQTLPLIYLSGLSTAIDCYVSERQNRIKSDEGEVQTRIIGEILNQDLLDKIESPPTPPPQMQDPDVFKKHFEQNNKHLSLYFTQGVMDLLYELLDDINSRIRNGRDYAYGWDGKIEYLEEIIEIVPNPYSRQQLHDRYVRILAQAKKIPNDRAHSYNVFKKMLMDLSEHTIEYEHKAREELQIMENLGFIVPNENQTEEEVKKLEEEKKAKKADWLKKTKKKAKTDEEEKLELEELQNKVVYNLKNELLHNKVQNAENEVEFVKTKWLFDNHIKMDTDQYDELYRLESILDIDISGKDLILRLDLDVPLSHYIPPPTQSQMNTLDEMNKSAANTRTKKTSHQLQQEALLQQQMQSQLQEEPWKKRDILDHTLIKKAVVDIRHCIERFANRTFIIGNLGERHGKIKPEDSMKIVYNVLQQQLMEQQMVFLPDSILKNFDQRKENEEFPESTTFVLENINFKPDEFGYVEPEKPIEDQNKQSEEELKKQQEEELKQQQAAQQKGGKQAAPAKLSAADKKKQEEESKKKAEEEATAKKRQEQLAILNAVSEEERHEQQRKKEEAERLKKELEYFDYKTTFNYKKLLGQYGDILVNDAPLMTLTQSNSIAETKCKKRVMGIRMTEEIRKLCLFFLKKNPYEIVSNWYRPPTQMAYHSTFTTAFIGGSGHTIQEILDKLLIANTFLDTFKHIHFYGEVGLAALYSLGIKVGKIERSSEIFKEWETVREFFQKLYEKACYKGVKLYFPTDVVVGHKIQYEDQDHHEEHQNQTQLSGQNNTKNITQQQNQDKTQKSQQNISMSQHSNEKQKNHFDIQPQVWKPYHWADKIIDAGEQRQVNIIDQVRNAWDKVVEKFWLKIVEEEKIELYGYYTSYNHPRASSLHFDGNSQSEVVVEPYLIDPEDYVLEYGEQTINQMINDMEGTFKCFWDGSLSLIKDAVYASNFNKTAVQKLLNFRQQTQNDDEPPVTLLHGSETEIIVRHSLMRIKVEQQEALDELKKIAAQNGEEVEEDDDQISMTNDESQAETSTFQQDLNQIADFLCFEIPQFTTKILQGVQNKSLLNLDQHPKKSKEQEEEDLFLLEEI